MYDSTKMIFFLSELKISALRLRYVLQDWMNLLRSFLSPLNALGVLIRISFGVAISSSSSLSYSDVSSSCDVVPSDSGSGSALDVVVVGRSADESGDVGGRKVVVFRRGAILYSWLLIQ